jgi:hypothetical protein
MVACAEHDLNKQRVSSPGIEVTLVLRLDRHKNASSITAIIDEPAKKRAGTFLIVQ